MTVHLTRMWLIYPLAAWGWFDLLVRVALRVPLFAGGGRR